jgi:hypothetical protein
MNLYAPVSTQIISALFDFTGEIAAREGEGTIELVPCQVLGTGIRLVTTRMITDEPLFFVATGSRSSLSAAADENVAVAVAVAVGASYRASDGLAASAASAAGSDALCRRGMIAKRATDNISARNWNTGGTSTLHHRIFTVISR